MYTNRWYKLLYDSFIAAISAARPADILPAHLPPPPAGKIIIVGAGKAAGGMALAAERHYSPQTRLCGAVVIPHGAPLPPLSRIRALSAAHPLPDADSVRAAKLLLGEVARAGADDLVVGLFSGGGSSLLGAPITILGKPPELLLNANRQVIHDLLHAGADVREINILRRHLSIVLGGRMAMACRAPALVLLMSDVVGDQPADIASGPFAADNSTCADVLAILAKYAIHCPQELRRMLENGIAETPKGDFRHVENRVIATSAQSLSAAEKCLRAGGVCTVINGGICAGSADDLAAEHQRQLLAHRHLPHPLALISSGEASAAVRGTGSGGANTEFALAMWQRGVADIILSGDTDGIDGNQQAAGAIFGAAEREQAAAMNLSAADYWDDSNSGGFFGRLNALIETGPTGVNVNDYRVCLVVKE